MTEQARAASRAPSAVPRQRDPARAPGSARRNWLLASIRYVLPVTVTVAGLAVMALGGEIDLEGGAGIVGAGLAIFFLNWLFRAGASSDREREREAAAREYFSKHGRWPD